MVDWFILVRRSVYYNMTNFVCEVLCWEKHFCAISHIFFIYMDNMAYYMRHNVLVYFPRQASEPLMQRVMYNFFHHDWLLLPTFGHVVQAFSFVMFIVTVPKSCVLANITVFAKVPEVSLFCFYFEVLAYKSVTGSEKVAPPEGNFIKQLFLWSGRTIK